MSELRTPPADVVMAAIDCAKRSLCRKSRRGAVAFAVADGKPFLCDGWNYPAIGACDGSDACRRDCGRICVHAEQDLLLSVIPYMQDNAHVVFDILHVEVDLDGRPVVSGTPSCSECSKLMFVAGTAGVWLLQSEGWRRWLAREFHEATLANLRLYRSKQ